jgi:two-component system chemotaxis response regulator CheB
MKRKIEKGTIYIAPPNYHLLIEKKQNFSLTIDERVNFARPSIDVLFESAAEAIKHINWYF